jgi:Fis family transcriptional regulator, factor for inversion stimulation protein
VYDMVLASVEKPLLEVVLQHVDGNQSRAADLLGLNRNTLRKKMNLYGIE